MSEKQKLELQLDQLERISLSVINVRKKYIFFTAIMISLLLYFGLVFLLFPSYFLITLFSIQLIIIVFYIKTIYTSYSSATLKGDSLILKNTKNQNCVTSIRSIRKVKSRKIGRNTYTALRYTLDGKTKKALLISDSETLFPPKMALQVAKRHFKNKRQIYKPGSVF